MQHAHAYLHTDQKASLRAGLSSSHTRVRRAGWRWGRRAWRARTCARGSRRGRSACRAGHGARGAGAAPPRYAAAPSHSSGTGKIL